MQLSADRVGQSPEGGASLALEEQGRLSALLSRMDLAEWSPSGEAQAGAQSSCWGEVGSASSESGFLPPSQFRNQQTQTAAHHGLTVHGLGSILQVVTLSGDDRQAKLELGRQLIGGHHRPREVD